jgi:hypothetical protein
MSHEGGSLTDRARAQSGCFAVRGSVSTSSHLPHTQPLFVVRYAFKVFVEVSARRCELGGAHSYISSERTVSPKVTH